MVARQGELAAVVGTGKVGLGLLRDSPALPWAASLDTLARVHRAHTRENR